MKIKNVIRLIRLIDKKRSRNIILSINFCTVINFKKLKLFLLNFINKQSIHEIFNNQRYLLIVVFPNISTKYRRLSKIKCKILNNKPILFSTSRYSSITIIPS